jgi:hypothetical protein
MTISGDDLSVWLDSLTDSDLSERRRAAERRRARAEQTLARLGVDQRKRDTRLKIVVGAAVMSVARRDPDFARRLRDLLDCELSALRDRVLVGLQPRP